MTEPTPIIQPQVTQVRVRQAQRQQPMVTIPDYTFPISTGDDFTRSEPGVLDIARNQLFSADNDPANEAIRMIEGIVGSNEPIPQATDDPNDPATQAIRMIEGIVGSNEPTPQVTDDPNDIATQAIRMIEGIVGANEPTPQVTDDPNDPANEAIKMTEGIVGPGEPTPQATDDPNDPANEAIRIIEGILERIGTPIDNRMREFNLGQFNEEDGSYSRPNDPSHYFWQADNGIYSRERRSAFTSGGVRKNLDPLPGTYNIAALRLQPTNPDKPGTVFRHPRHEGLFYLQADDSIFNKNLGTYVDGKFKREGKHSKPLPSTMILAKEKYYPTYEGNKVVWKNKHQGHAIVLNDGSILHTTKDGDSNLTSAWIHNGTKWVQVKLPKPSDKYYEKYKLNADDTLSGSVYTSTPSIKILPDGTLFQSYTGNDKNKHTWRYDGTQWNHTVEPVPQN